VLALDICGAYFINPGRPPSVTDDWSEEQTDNPRYADDRNFYKLEKWK
jgi:hypothetical protein